MCIQVYTYIYIYIYIYTHMYEHLCLCTHPYTSTSASWSRNRTPSCSWPKAMDIRGFTEELQHKTCSEVMALPSAAWIQILEKSLRVDPSTHQQPGSSGKFSRDKHLKANAMIAKTMDGKCWEVLPAVIWTDTSTRNLIVSARSHSSSRLLFYVTLFVG